MIRYIHKFSGVLLFFGSLIAITVLTSQNVGINTTTPQENLDVNGNIGVSGAIVPGGQTGTAGQILEMQSGGSMAWIDMIRFENFKQFRVNPFTGTNSYSFSIPTGVTVIMAELWAGGGSGRTGGGGGAGGYVLCEIDVSSASTLTIEVGKGGASTGTTAGFSKITIPSTGQFMRADEGVGATSTKVGLGGAAGYTNNILIFNYIGFMGEDGSPSTRSYQQNSTANYTTFNYGNGGSSYNHPRNGGKGYYKITSSTGTTPAMTYPTDGNVPGGGGGGGDGSNYTDGGDGLVILYW